jgi:hypothetical protein
MIGYDMATATYPANRSAAQAVVRMQQTWLVMDAPGYQKNLLPLWTRPKNRTTV